MEDLKLYLQESASRKLLHVENALLDSLRNELPDYAGIYFVFVGKASHDENGFRMSEPRLIYIGEAKDINDRHNNEDGTPKHEHYKDFASYLREGESIAYAFAPVNNGPFTRKLIESALIYHFQPPINIKSKYSFSHRRTIINITSNKEFPFNGEIIVEEAK